MRGKITASLLSYVLSGLRLLSDRNNHIANTFVELIGFDSHPPGHEAFLVASGSAPLIRQFHVFVFVHEQAEIRSV
jgi:hypothetical protein